MASWTLVHFSSIQVSRNGPFHNQKFHWACLFTLWNSNVNDLYTWQILTADVVRTKVDLFDVCLSASLLREALILVQRRAYDTMTSRIFSSRSSSLLVEWSCIDKSWTWVSRNGLDASGQSQRVFPEALQGRRCLQARRLRTRCQGLVLDPQEVRHQGAAVAIWRVSCCDTVL